MTNSSCEWYVPPESVKVLDQATFRPSGDHAGSAPGTLRACWLLPSEFITQRDSPIPPRVLWKAILPPSGDHDGALLSPAAKLVVSRVSPVPSALTMKMSLCPPHASSTEHALAKTILVPSGDHSGSVL